MRPASGGRSPSFQGARLPPADEGGVEAHAQTQRVELAARLADMVDAEECHGAENVQAELRALVVAGRQKELQAQLLVYLEKQDYRAAAAVQEKLRAPAARQRLGRSGDPGHRPCAALQSRPGGVISRRGQRPRRTVGSTDSGHWPVGGCGR